MKTKVCLITLILLFAGSFLSLNADERQDLWIKAAAEKNLETRLQYFEEYKEKYGDAKKDNNSRFLYYNLTQTAFMLNKFEKVIEYGEKALTFEDLEDNYKLDSYLWLANAYNLARKNYDKAYSYADKVIDLGKSLKEMAQGSERAMKMTEGIDKSYVAPALRLQVKFQTAKGLNNANARIAVIEKALEAHSLDDSNPFTRRTVLKESVALFRQNMIDEPINFVEKVVDIENPSYSEANLLATLHYRKYGKTKNQEEKDSAINFYEKAYAKKKKGDLAVKIGQLLSKKDKNKAIQYFADAFVLSKENKQSDAYKYLQQLWFKEIASQKAPAEQEAGFKEIINAAKTRLDMSQSDEGANEDEGDN